MNLRKFQPLVITILLAIVASVYTVTVSAQQDFPLSASDRVIEDPDLMPIFTGGTGEMHRFIANTLSYPTEAVERDAQGLVV